MSLFARCYAAVLALTPAGFRDRYADEATALAVARMTATRGFLPRVTRAVRELSDAAGTVIAERRAARASALPSAFPAPRGSVMDAIIRDFRLAVRALLRAPAFTIAAIATLAVGIGSTALMFTAVDAAFLRPLPFGEPDRLARLWQVSDRSSRIRVAGPTWRDWQQMQSFSSLAASSGSGSVTVKAAGEPERITGTPVSRNFFDTFGVAPTMGRGFSDEEAQINGPLAVVIAHSLWERGFGRDPQILSKTIDVEGMPVPIVGVMPPGFRFPADSEIWTTFEREEDRTTRTAHNFDVFGRLAPGATLESAGAELETATRALHAIDPDMAREGLRVRVADLREDLLGGSGQTVSLLFGAVSLVLLIGCANVVNLLLARSAARQGQMTLRLAIGASRAALVRIMVVESLALSLAGGILGALLTIWTGALAEGLLPAALLSGGDLRPSPATFGVIGFLLLAVGLVCGLVSSWHTLRQPLRASLGGGRGVEGEPIAMRVLVAVEVALAVMLLAGAGVLLRSLVKLEAVDLGFRGENAIVTTFSLGSSPASPYSEADARARFLDRVLDAAAQTGALGPTGVTSSFPLGRFNANALLEEEGATPGVWGRDPATSYRVVGGRYFEAMDISLVAGRQFDERDRAGAPHAALINESAARNLGGPTQALGRRVRMRNVDGYDEFATIVGVVADIRHTGAAGSPQPEVFFHYPQRPRRTYGMTLVSAPPVDTSVAAQQLRAIVRAVDPGIPVTIEPIQERIGEQFATARFRTGLLGAFAAIATLLAVCGVFGVVSYGVARRTREIGIRLALGARTGAVRRMVLTHALKPVTIGAVIGLAGAIAGNRLLGSLTFQVDSADPGTFTVATIGLILVALAGAAWPAARATRVDPLIALRND